MIVDVHAHYIPPSCIDLESIERESQTYTIRITRPGNGEVLFNSRSVPRGYDAEQIYSVDRRLRDMQRQGVDMHVLATPPFGFVYDEEPATGLAICQVMNDAIAETVSRDRVHFVGLATLPMQAPETAARELERAVREMGLKGAEIGTNAAGKNLDDPGLAPFYAKVQELDVPIFIHSCNVLGAERLRGYHLGNLVGNPTEDALAAASLIFGGVLEEFSGLNFYIAHGGGSGPYLRGRWEHGWRVREEAKVKILRPPSQYFSRLRFDTLTHHGPGLNYLVETVGPERVLLGTDYPFDMSDPDPLKTVAAVAHLSDRERELICGTNAVELFKLA